MSSSYDIPRLSTSISRRAPTLVGIGAGSTATPLVDPASGQPPLLAFVGCYSLLQ